MCNSILTALELLLALMYDYFYVPYKFYVPHKTDRKFCANFFSRYVAVKIIGICVETCSEYCDYIRLTER